MPSPHVVPDPINADVRDVQRCLTGDQDAFSSLVERHQSRLRAHAATIVGHIAADDVAQEAFVRAWRALDRYDSRYPFRAWLLVITTRLAINHTRRQRPIRAIAELADCAAPLANPDTEDTNRARLRQLEQVLHQLSPDDRSLFELRYRQDLDPSAVAEALGITANALRVRLHRLRQRLQVRLGITTDLAEDP